MKKSTIKTSAKSSKSKYFYIFLFVVASAYTVFNTAMRWKITPSQEQVQYTIGLVGIDNENGVATLNVLSSPTLKDKMAFECGYSMKFDSQSDQCLDESLLKSIKGGVATIGWYKLRGIFGLRNPNAQMVSIEVNNKYLKSYNETRVLNEGYNNIQGLLTCITLFIYFVILQIVLFLLRRNSIATVSSASGI